MKIRRLNPKITASREVTWRSHDKGAYFSKNRSLSVSITPDTTWSCIRPLRGVPSLGTRYWFCVDTERGGEGGKEEERGENGGRKKEEREREREINWRKNRKRGKGKERKGRKDKEGEIKIMEYKQERETYQCHKPQSVQALLEGNEHSFHLHQSQHCKSYN